MCLLISCLIDNSKVNIIDVKHVSQALRIIGMLTPQVQLGLPQHSALSWKPLSRRCAHGLLKGSVRVARLWQGSVWYLSHLLSAPHPGEPGGVLCLILAVGWHWTSSKSKGLLCPVLSAPQ